MADRNLRVLAWNVGGLWNLRNGPAAAKRCCALAAAVGALEPDVVFISEWSPAPIYGSSGLQAEFAAIGLPHAAHNHRIDKHWSVLAVARSPIERVIDHDDTYPEYSPSAWVEVRHSDTGLTLVGLRVQAWEKGDIVLRRRYWEWMVDQFDRLANIPAVVTGDFNTEMTYPSEARARRFGGDLLRSVTRERGWVDAFDACRERKVDTYFSNNGRKKRLDYAFVSRASNVTVVSAGAPIAVAGHVLGGPLNNPDGSRTGRLADHSPVLVELRVTDSD